jgi:hypothetical protein
MNPLELRKQLLIAESELNRAQLIEHVTVLTSRVRAMTGRAKSFGSIASAAALLVTGLSALKRGRTGGAESKPSWINTMLKGAGLVSSFWLALRARRRDHQDKPTE